MNALRTSTVSEIRALSSSAALRARYGRIYAGSRQALLENKVNLEQFIGTQNPGVSLLVHVGGYPSSAVKPLVGAQERLREADPSLYLHATDTLHIGAFLLNPSYNHDMEESVGQKEVYSGRPIFEEKEYERYCEAIRAVLAKRSPFDIRFSGVCASTSAVFAQGIDGGALNDLRLRLWDGLEQEGLPFVDRQPNIVHCTLARFVGPLSQPAGFVKEIDRLRTSDLGSIRVRQLSLIREGLAYLESYQLLHTFPLGA